MDAAMMTIWASPLPWSTQHSAAALRDLASVLALQQLQHLTLCPDFATQQQQQQVLELAQLTSLQELHLGYCARVFEEERAVRGAAAAAPT
ncbi:hypothetical protein OEZ85_005942 [Tetradesmus obliquus]|uniref:Uncharacterized protein n=1 Tax=Tetradesmus obliquus TaxID=3088 RepID=A0ABY8UFN8_TETOB|nr:hypothetical protein OEZ85_005942 [Tetradesmus obliquus]